MQGILDSATSVLKDGVKAIQTGAQVIQTGAQAMNEKYETDRCNNVTSVDVIKCKNEGCVWSKDNKCVPCLGQSLSECPVECDSSSGSCRKRI